jgi:hypothetical protein
MNPSIVCCLVGDGIAYNVWQRNAVVVGAKKNIHSSNSDYQNAPKTIERPL